MKIKKEFIILIIVILVLSGYLYFKRTDRIHYTLPDLPSLQPEQITSIEITSAGNSIVLKRKDKSWYISGKDYPVDAKKAQAMLEMLNNLAITDLVSESGNYILYDLQDDKKVAVKAYEGTKIVREFDIGKKAPSYRHTFVRLKGDDKVYQASGDLREEFDTTVADLRDKRVLTFDTSKITGITISEAKKKIVLSKEETPSETTNDQTQKEKKTVKWKDGSGKVVKSEAVEKLLGTLSPLDCEEYLEDKAKTDLKSPETTIVLKGTKEYTLLLFAGQGEKKPASSSENPYVFALPEYRVDSIKKDIAELTGAPAVP